MTYRNIFKRIDTLNRKLHIYIGLYLLLFIWLFSVTGLLLNHPQWRFSQFWSQRQTSTFEWTVEWPTDKDDLRIARSLLKQLSITGEIEGITISRDNHRFDIRVVKPGKIIDIKIDRMTNHANVEQIRVNTWGIMNMLHTFTGVRMNEPAKNRHWIMNQLWSLSIDALSIGFVVLVFGGLYMWYETKQKRRLGFVLLLIGMISCGVFVLGWLP